MRGCPPAINTLHGTNRDRRNHTAYAARMRDLTLTAESNAGARRAAAEAAVADDHSGTVAAFREFAGTSRFSTNATADKICAYGAAGEVLDTRGSYIHTVGGDATKGLEDFAAAQESWLARREAFEDLWHHGRRLLYGAVNAGGLGPTDSFGSFCLLVDDPEDPPADALAVFPGDSVRRYTTPDGVVDEQRCVEEVTPWGERADLAVLECAGEAAAAPEEDWPQLLCRDHRYLEVVRAGRIPVTALAETRLRSGERSRLDGLRARVLAGDELAPVEANEVAAYDVLHTWRRSHGTPINEGS